MDCSLTVTHYGTFQIDFYISWAGVVDEDYNGYSVGSAELYNYINYALNSGIYIKQLESFQDAYASYLVYQHLLGQISSSQLPGDVEVIAGGGGSYNSAYLDRPRLYAKSHAVLIINNLHGRRSHRRDLWFYLLYLLLPIIHNISIWNT